MISLVLERAYRGKEYTIGKLYINNKYFCDTLEDVDRGLTYTMPLEKIQAIKIKDQTAIPIGQYKVAMNISSPKYSNFAKYPWAKPYQGKLPRLLNVPGYSGVLIHPGNTKNDTSGCILLGTNDIKGKVINSQKKWKEFMEIITKDKDNIILTIKYPR